MNAAEITFAAFLFLALASVRKCLLKSGKASVQSNAFKKRLPGNTNITFEGRFCTATLFLYRSRECFDCYGKNLSLFVITKLSWLYSFKSLGKNKHSYFRVDCMKRFLPH
jgi:hypothetical protein